MNGNQGDATSTMTLPCVAATQNERPPRQPNYYSVEVNATVNIPVISLHRGSTQGTQDTKSRIHRNRDEIRRSLKFLCDSFDELKLYDKSIDAHSTELIGIIKSKDARIATLEAHVNDIEQNAKKKNITDSTCIVTPPQPPRQQTGRTKRPATVQFLLADKKAEILMKRRVLQPVM